MKITNLRPDETCQSRCFRSPLCGVWAVENSTAANAEMTCWQGMFGQNCYDTSNGLNPPPGAYFRAQRVMHGSVRVLTNIAHMQIMNLTQAFGISHHSDEKEGAEACRLTCISYLLCQYWQYSDVYGCYVESPFHHSVAYPLVNNGIGLSTTSYRATTFKVGEYIQHTCDHSANQTVPPFVLTAQDQHGEAVVKHEAVAKLEPETPAIEVAPLPPVAGGAQQVVVAQKPPFPLWAQMLILGTIGMCLAVIGAAVWMTLVDSKKKGSQGFYGYNIHRPGYFPQSDSFGSQSFDSQAQGAPLVGYGAYELPATQHLGWVGSLQQSFSNLPIPGTTHWQHANLAAGVNPALQQGQGMYGAQVGTGQPFANSGFQPGAPGMAPPSSGMYSQYAMPPSRDQLMQYAHQGFGY